LILVSLALQIVATTRVFCPPRALTALAPLRIACPPRLWPFTDYPMFSEPHRRGDTLAWIGVTFEYPGGTKSSRGEFEIRRTAPEETWASAFDREESLLRAELGAQLSGASPTARVSFERHLLVLTERGLTRPDADGATGAGK
jgi:hypothetical protein